MTQSGGTAVGALLGTVGYMSPEQARGAVVDHRSDQFALGIILYELATGRRAFRRDSAPQTLAAIIQDELDRVDIHNPRVPGQLSHIVSRCLAKKPDDRYESTRDLTRDLKDLAHEGSTPSLATAPLRRKRVARLAIAAAFVLLASVVAYWMLRARDRVVSTASANRRIVAVLPFRDLTGDSARAYFAAGVTDEIRGQLAKLGALRVLSQSAVQRYGET